MTVLFRNTLFMLLFNVFGRASGLVRYLLCMVFLTDTEWGIVFFALQYSGIARHFIDGGLDNLVTRDGARRKDLLPTYTATALALKAVLAAIFLVFSFWFLPTLDVIQEKRTTALVAVLFVSALSLTGVLRSGFSALERMEYVFYTHGPCRVIALACTFLGLWSGAGLPLLVAYIYSENVLWLVLCFYFIRRFYRVTDGSCTPTHALSMLKESWPLAVYGFFNVLYLRMDTMMMKWLTPGYESVGIYGQSQYLVEGVTLVISGYIVAVFPIFSRLYGHNELRFRGLYTQSLAVMVAMTLPAAFLLGGYAEFWQALIPNARSGMLVLLPVLAGTMISAICNSFLISIFTARDRQRWLVFFLGIAVAVGFLSNYILIPKYSYIGAAAASLFTQISLLTLMIAILWVRMELPAPLLRWAYAFLACLAAYGLFRLVPDSSWYIRPFLFCALAPAALFGFRIIGLHDIQLFRQLAADSEKES